MNRKTWFLLVVAGLSWSDGHSRAAADANCLALVVNKTSAIIGVSKGDLKAIYLGEKDHWPNGQKVLPIALSSGPELKSFLKEVCAMSEADYKKYFIQANFTGKTLVLPRLAPSGAAVKALVSSTPGAIGFIRASDVDASIGVARYNGAMPGDSGYPLSVSP